MNDAADPESTFKDEATLCAEASQLPVERVQELAKFALDHGQTLVRTLVDRGGVDEPEMLRNLAKLLDFRYLGEPPTRILPEWLKKLPASLAMSMHIIPVDTSDNGMLHVACSDPFEWRQWEELGQLLGCRLRKVLCPRPVIERMLRTNYGLGADTVERIVADRSSEETTFRTTIATDLSEQEAANEPTVVNLVNRILTEAIRVAATDIHFEPYDSKYRVRYRIDGMLEDVSIPVSVKLLKLALVSRIKIMANLDITEKRLPQDGRAHVALAGQDYDLRVSILPGVYGEAVNIRIQSRQMVKLDLESLGFESEERSSIEKLVERPHGLVLVTGPTGSGKTTTLYSCLGRINKPETKIITVEDPFEYWMEDIVQMQVHEEIGFTFARSLRSMLRHDPDVMLVGEIRDRETADIAIRASLTGHRVFATLHTNNAASAITRLLDLGIEPFLLASSVSGVVAQRLVRTVCKACCREIHADASDEVETSLQGFGCERCRFTGYSGRSAVAEVLTTVPHIRTLIQERAAADQIQRAAIEQAMRTLRQTAMLAVRSGRTTLAEAMRVTMDEF